MDKGIEALINKPIHQERKFQFIGKKQIEYWAEIDAGAYKYLPESERRIVYSELEVKALIAALEQARTEREEFRKRLKLERQIVEDAEKRIAEQEDKEIREDGNQFLVVRHAGKAPVIKHSAGDMADFLRQIIKHNPLVTIDIVTHRYYGVGGQYVQDADEYLRAAGGTVEGE